MLEIRLERAMEPEAMEGQSCGVCGADFQPKAVLAVLMTDPTLPSVCEPCLSHLAQRAEDEAVPARWSTVYADYLSAVARYTEPVFPTLEALLRAEEQDPRWEHLSGMMKV
jgi:hypothetical protein